MKKKKEKELPVAPRVIHARQQRRRTPCKIRIYRLMYEYGRPYFVYAGKRRKEKVLPVAPRVILARDQRRRAPCKVRTLHQRVMLT